MNVKHHYRGVRADMATAAQAAAVKASLEDNAASAGWPPEERVIVRWYVEYRPVNAEQCKQYCLAHTNMPMDSAIIQYAPNVKNCIYLRLDLDSVDTYDRVAQCMGELATSLTKEQ
ncbi:hypothetical protein ACF06P_19675 [Streptomyces sp. NPDC015684]|uniref:hypothetical protein n=1 Tax=Streptomyces sp. NPDC015684 TaxID=3364963 RepID=UPI0036FCB6C6